MPTMLDKMIAGLMPAVPRPIVRRVSQRYIAGESVDDAIDVARALGQRGIGSTMDILGEHTDNREKALDYTRLYLELLDQLVAAGVDRNVSIKLTQFGLLIDRSFCLDNMRRVMERAAQAGAKVRIDMEDSGCTDDTLWVFRELRRDHAHLGVVLQAYLHRTLSDIAELSPLRPDYRLCKGIYLEAPEVAIQDPAEINRNFLAALEAMWDGGSYVGIATHDEKLVDAILPLIEQRGLDAGRYEFQMLLGVCEKLRDRLLAAGHPMRVYIPYGREWYAYCVRRLKENPSVAGHVFRAFWN